MTIHDLLFYFISHSFLFNLTFRVKRELGFNLFFTIMLRLFIRKSWVNFPFMVKVALDNYINRITKCIVHFTPGHFTKRIPETAIV